MAAQRFRQGSRLKGLREEHFKRLVEADDPIEEVWKILVELWNPNIKLEEYFIRQEPDVSIFEQKLNATFFEIYRYLYERTSKEAFKLDLPLIIMDGMSIREGNLLRKDLRDKGYEIVEYSYGFSKLPSNTASFRECVKEYTKVSGKVPSSLDFKKPVWVSYPDEILHHAAKIDPPPEAYEKTKRLLFDILGRIDDEMVTITSDHGYIMTDYVWQLEEDDIKFLKKVFRTDRYVELSKVDGKDLEKMRAIPEDVSYVFMDTEYCYVRGRYFWPTPGYPKLVDHGGLSLMECIVPRIKVKL